MGEIDYSVYVVERGKRPRLVEVPLRAGKVPAEIVVAGKTFYWITADLSARTLTFSDWKPNPTVGVES